MRRLALLVFVFACEGKPSQKTEPKAAEQKRTLAHWRMEVPHGWTATPDPEGRAWAFMTNERTTVVFHRAPRHAVASPEAYLHHRKGSEKWPAGTTHEFEKREALSDGFAVTVTMRAPTWAARRETYVVREIGSEWFECGGGPIIDDNMRDEVVALCRSIKP